MPQTAEDAHARPRRAGTSWRGTGRVLTRNPHTRRPGAARPNRGDALHPESHASGGTEAGWDRIGAGKAEPLVEPGRLGIGDDLDPRGAPVAAIRLASSMSARPTPAPMRAGSTNRPSSSHAPCAGRSRTAKPTTSAPSSATRTRPSSICSTGRSIASGWARSCSRYAPQCNDARRCSSVSDRCSAARASRSRTGARALTIANHYRRSPCGTPRVLSHGCGCARRFRPGARSGRFSSVLGRSLARLLPRSMRQYGHTCWAHRCAAANRPIRVSALRLEVPAFSRKRNLASRCATVAAFCVGEVLRLVACRGLWDRGRPRDHAVTVTACAPGKTCACFGRR
jgi:hypothetical protein